MNPHFTTKKAYDGHPEDGLSRKYAKPAHTKPYARISEPIYCLESIKDGQSVLVTVGIADGITAREHPIYDLQDAATCDCRQSSQWRRYIRLQLLGTVRSRHSRCIRSRRRLSWSDPARHHGERETYFVVIDERDVAFDHKYKAAYNVLTYLLVDAGERPPDTQTDALTMANCSLRGDTPNERVSFPTTIRFPGAHFGTSPLTTATGHCESSDIEDG